MSDQPQLSEIGNFFSDYTKVFDERNGAAIATYYHAPSITMRADASVHVFQTRQDLQEFFQNVAEKYYAEGLRRSTFTNLDVNSIGSKSVLATLKWQMLRGDGSKLRERPVCGIAEGIYRTVVRVGSSASASPCAVHFRSVLNFGLPLRRTKGRDVPTADMCMSVLIDLLSTFTSDLASQPP